MIELKNNGVLSQTGAVLAFPRALDATAEVDEAKAGLVDLAKLFLRCRRQLGEFLPVDLVGDPVHELLLDLYIAQADGRLVDITSARLASGTPPTTALRWVHTLTERGMLIRTRDRGDGRRILLRLSDQTNASIEGWLSLMAKMLREEGRVLPRPPGAERATDAQRMRED